MLRMPTITKIGRIIRGKTPMTKNITVSNINNQTLGLTYNRRAKQLVKKGRAKWIDEKSIQLEACPPYNKEDYNMSEDTNMVYNEINTDEARQVNNLDECVKILQKMSNETTNLTVALDALNCLPEDQRTGALKDIYAIVEQTETTKRQIVTAIDSFFKITREQDDSIVGRYENGRIYHRILEYYQAGGGASVIGDPADNGGSEYVHKWGEVTVQDFDGGIYGYCNIMSSAKGVFIIKGVFREKYHDDNCINYLKAPTSEEYETERGVRQDFQGGYMLYDPETDDIMVYTKVHGSSNNNWKHWK